MIKNIHKKQKIYGRISNNYLTKKTGLNPDFSFSEMVIEIRELLGEGKGVATSTIKNFYQRKTNTRRKKIEAIQQWVEKEKKKRSGE